MKRFVLVAGARPNFIKIAPIYAALRSRGADVRLVHTGQHYDPAMSDVFFEELSIPRPDVSLEIGSGTRIVQTEKIINGLVPYLQSDKPDMLLVVGDVTSTAAATLAGITAGVPVAHIEAGLRSYNWNMPEELNRMIADHYATYHFVTEEKAKTNLLGEGFDASRIFFVGNVMIDTLRRMEPSARGANAAEKMGLPARYGIVTLHRPENVDNQDVLREMWSALTKISEELMLVFPVHPRTKGKLETLGMPIPSGIRLVEPLGYTSMLSLLIGATCIFTDSGGLQEEATAVGIPCLTLRTETERPVTVDSGTSEIVGRTSPSILEAWSRVQTGVWKRGRMPELWDGHAAERIADILIPLEAAV